MLERALRLTIQSWPRLFGQLAADFEWISGACQSVGCRKTSPSVAAVVVAKGLFILPCCKFSFLWVLPHFLLRS